MKNERVGENEKSFTVEIKICLSKNEDNSKDIRFLVKKNQLNLIKKLTAFHQKRKVDSLDRKCQITLK